VTGGVVIVDYLGRGGIAQAAWGYAEALRAASHEVTLVTRAGREVPAALPGVVGVRRPRGGAAVWHAAVLARAAREIRRRRPETVVVQNYWAPLAEVALLRVAHRAGAGVVLAVHNHVPHGPGTGLRTGLNRLLREADTWVAHSRFVAERLPPGGRPVHVLPLPNLLGLADAVAPATPATPPRLLHFGVLTRGYKGAGLVRRLAREGAGRWGLRLVGVGAGPPEDGLSTRDEFVPLDELVAEVTAASAVLLPYQAATQSAAVRMAQSLGRAPVASAVGGIPEQITAGHDGLLVRGEAGPAEWRAVLEDLSVADAERMGRAARARAEADDAAFVSGIAEVLGAPPPRSLSTGPP
jgi:glycosyltransferase involved in cell wall biosynthesis